MSREKSLRLAAACSILTILVVTAASRSCELVGSPHSGPVEGVGNESSRDEERSGRVSTRGDAQANEAVGIRAEVSDPRIRVVVLAEESSEPIPDALVMVVDDGNRITQSANADAKGELVLKVGGSDEVALVAQCRGYVPKRLAAVSPAARVDVVFHLSRGRSLMGSVLDQRGSPIDGARLSIMQVSGDFSESAWTGCDTALSDSHGRFEVRGCSSGTYAVVATHDHYVAAESSVTMVPGRAGTIIMLPVAVAVVKWLSRDGAPVYPRGAIELDGADVSLDFSRERSAFLGANGNDPVAAMFRRGEVLLRSGEAREGSSLTCRARIHGFESVSVELRKWSLGDVLAGRALPDEVRLDMSNDAVMVRVEVRYAGQENVAPFQVLPLGLESLESGDYVTEARIGLATPGDAVFPIAPGGYRMTVGYPYQTLGVHDIRVGNKEQGPALFRIGVERGADLVLRPSPLLGSGQRVGLSALGGPAGPFDTGLFAVRATSPIPWTDMKPGPYRVRCQGAQGKWIGWGFELVRGERYELKLQP